MSAQATPLDHEAGDGPPVVLLHGQGGSAGIWLPLRRVLGWLTDLVDATCEQPPALLGLVTAAIVPSLRDAA